MANVLNRTTKELRLSVNTPDFSTDDWIINPDLSAVSGVDKKYWIISGDVVTGADASTITTLNAAELAQAKIDYKAIVDTRYDLIVRNSSSSQRDIAKANIDAATTVGDVMAAADNFRGN